MTPFWDRFGKKEAYRVQSPPSTPHVQPMIQIPNGFDAQIVFSQLEDYLEELRQNKRTKYDNSPNYCEEDESFLSEAIERTQLMLLHLSYQHRNLVRKM